MARHSPFEELERLVDEMQATFEDSPVRLRRRPADGRRIHARPRGVRRRVRRHGRPPGFEKSDVDVRFEDRRLVVDAERASDETTENDGHYLRRERRRAASVQSVTFPGEVRSEDVSATMTNGVLTVTVPKADGGSGGRRVDIE